MSYFPSDIPFMSEEERKENGIRIPKDSTGKIDVYIYKLDLNVEKPVVEKFPAQIRTGVHGNNEVIYWVGPNDYRVWYSGFDIRMLGVVYEPIGDVIELITKRDDSTELEDLTKIEGFCTTEISYLVKRKNVFHKGISAIIKFSNRPRRLSDYLVGTRVSRPIDITDDQFDGDPVLVIPGPFEGEERIK